jgi:hypothetical protein
MAEVIRVVAMKKDTAAATTATAIANKADHTFKNAL